MNWIELKNVDITQENQNIISDGLYLVSNRLGDFAIVERFFGTWQPYSQGTDDFEINKFCKIIL